MPTTGIPCKRCAAKADKAGCKVHIVTFGVDWGLTCTTQAACAGETTTMPEIYTVQANDTLSKIAKKYNFRDGGDAIWNANPETRQRTGGNRDVLREGWKIKIPDKTGKDAGKPSDQRGTQQVTIVKKNLSLILRDTQGNPVDGTWKYRFVQGSGTPQEGDAGEGKIILKDIDEDTSEATLTVFQSEAFGIWKSPPEKITLYIGGLDPISGGSDGITAIQKILTNLGYYADSVDGQAGPLTNAAILGFKHDRMPGDHTLDINQQFVEELQKAQGIQVGVEDLPDAYKNDSCGFAPSDDFASPLTTVTLGEEAGEKTEAVTGFSEYEEPTANDPSGEGKPYSPAVRVKMGTLRFFPRMAYVAPCAPGEEDKKANSIKMPVRKFLFLDAGNFYSNHTTFGVIWGHHVYLCKYEAGYAINAPGEPPQGKRLDDLFFSAMGSSVSILTQAAARWAPYSDFDWEKLYLIIPDMHMMSADTAKIWHAHDGESAPYDFDIEKKFNAFAATLVTNTQDGPCAALRSGTKMVQIGDSYDLWIGCEPLLFTKNPTRQVLLDTSKPLTDASKASQTPVQRIAQWVKEIAEKGPEDMPGTGNPAVQGLKLLEENFGGMDYIYGNHDNYLIREDVCAEAGLTQRQRWQEYPGVFIEHGHRLEGTFEDGGIEAAGAVVGALGTLGVIGLAAAGIGGVAAPIAVGVVAAAGVAAAVITAVAPHNYDGDPSGYNAADGVFKNLKGASAFTKFTETAKKNVADVWADVHDQPQYWGEFAQMWLGRQMPDGMKESQDVQNLGDLKSPHIFVIGHTHIPFLTHIKIDPYRIG